MHAVLCFDTVCAQTAKTHADAEYRKREKEDAKQRKQAAKEAKAAEAARKLAAALGGGMDVPAAAAAAAMAAVGGVAIKPKASVPRPDGDGYASGTGADDNMDSEALPGPGEEGHEGNGYVLDPEAAAQAEWAAREEAYEREMRAVSVRTEALGSDR